MDLIGENATGPQVVPTLGVVLGTSTRSHSESYLNRLDEAERANYSRRALVAFAVSEWKMAPRKKQEAGVRPRHVLCYRLNGTIAT